MKQFISKFAVSILLAISMTGCSQKYQDVQDTMSLALFGHDDVALPPQQVTDLPYASMYAKVEGSAQAFLVLAYAEPANHSENENTRFQLKWLSANGEMLVTENGRIVKTVNLLNANLLGSYSDQPDPLALGLLNESTPKQWQRLVDWQPGNNFSVFLDSQFENKGAQTILVNDSPKETLYFVEHVQAPQINARYQNHFWLNAASGDVVASIQVPAPGFAAIETTVLKPFAGESK